MALFKCKMCGGNLNIAEGVSVVECEYCGTQQTVPNADDEKKLAQFSRANKLRFTCEFDKAAGIYESIVADFPEEAEAFWGLVLCKYGIEYVDDPASGKKIPTCHRSSFDSVMDDTNFEQALENADAIARRVYRDEAKAIEELRKGIIEVSSKEEPYDIFICYKETDEFGDRTIDSVIAQDIYNALVDKGYRVFFSRITLEDKLGQEYEPYIFAALNSAKVMLAVGTDYEYYNAVWVKNEWSRFLQLMTKDKTKHLIPCYKNIDAYDMPKEFAKLQAQDMGKVGAMQDLLRGIEKILPREEKKEAVKETVVLQQNNGPDVSSLLKRAFMFLEDGNWSSANEYCEKVLDIDPENAEAYLGKLMAKLRVKQRENLSKENRFFDNDPNYKKAQSFAGNELKQELKAYLEAIADSKYRSALQLMEQNTLKSCEEAEENLNEIKEYKDVVDLFEKIKSQKEALTANLPKKMKLASELSKLIAFGRSHIVGLKSDGTVVAVNTEKYDHGECDVDDWQGIISVACGEYHTVGLKDDGTVVAVGSNSRHQCDVHNWRDIVAIACGKDHTVGLKSDGTVVAVGGYNTYGECNVSGWKDIIAIACASYYTLGLISDGTIIFAGDCPRFTSNKTDWWNIVSVVCHNNHIVAIRENGTVVAAHSFKKMPYDISGWENVANVTCCPDGFIGLTLDGNVLASGEDLEGLTQKDVDHFHNVMAVIPGLYHGVEVLRTDGVFVPSSIDNIIWRDIVAVTVQNNVLGKTENIVGIKSDGTVVSYKSDLGVSDWKLFDNADTFIKEKQESIDRRRKARFYQQAIELMEKAKESNSLLNYSAVAATFDKAGDYSDAKQKAAACRAEADKLRKELIAKKSALETELSNLKGMFAVIKRKQIESQIAEINEQLK